MRWQEGKKATLIKLPEYQSWSRLALLAAVLVLQCLVLWSCSNGNTLQASPVIPTATKTNPSVTPTASKTNTPVTPTITETSTPVPPTAMITDIPRTPTATNSTPTPAEYYVSMTGSDQNPGSITQPWKTFRKAVETMLGGDTVYIRGGTYNEPVKINYKTNTTGQYLTLAAYPGEEVIVDGTGIVIDYNQEGLIYVKRTDYVRISGLKVQHSNGAGIYIGYANHVIVENNQTYDTVKSGISTWGATNVVIDSNDIALACNPHPNYPMSEENISVDNTSNFEIKNNYVHKASNIADGSSGGEGINVKDGSSFGKVHNNVVHLDERADGKPSNRLGFGLDAWNNANGTHDIEYYNNVSYNNYVGFIVSSEQGGPVENIKVYNNIAYNNASAGFAVVWWSGTKDGTKKNIQFFNNVSYHNGIGFENTSPKNQNVVVRNNIFSQNTTPVQLLSGSEGQFTIDHNLFYESGGTYGTNTVIGDPKFINPVEANFQLQSSSPAIDAGSSLNAPDTDFAGNSRPRGAGYDIGAYEY
jgi:hypothetical protein